jgi:hypothetical protein
MTPSSPLVPKKFDLEENNNKIIIQYDDTLMMTTMPEPDHYDGMLCRRPMERR